jgi:amino acid transporter
MITAYAEDGTTGRLHSGRLQFFRTVAESVGVQGPTAVVVIAAGVLASVSGGGTALVQVVAAVAMGFVAYAFVLFTRAFNSAGSVYGFTGAVVGPRFGFLSAWALMVVYVGFAGGTYATAAAEATPWLDQLGLHLAWQVYALVAFAVVMALAFLDIRFAAAVILALEAASMLLVLLVTVVIAVRSGNHGHGPSLEPLRPQGVALSVLGLGVVLTFSSFSGFEAAATLGEEARHPQRLIPRAIASSLMVVAAFTIVVTLVVTSAFPSTAQLAADPVPVVTLTETYVADWVGELVSVGATASAFGVCLACVLGASRILFALGRDAGPPVLRRTTRAGAPSAALVCIGVASLVVLLTVIGEEVVTQAVAVSVAYAADLIVVVYLLVEVAAIIFTVRRRMSWVRTAVLVLGVVILGYVIKVTFVPLPEPPFRWDALAAAVTLVVGIALPIVYAPLRRGIRDSPLLRAGADALLPGDGPR